MSLLPDEVDILDKDNTGTECLGYREKLGDIPPVYHPLSASGGCK